MDSPEPAQPSANEAPSGLNKGAILILAMVVLGVGALVISSLSTPSPEEDFEKRLDAPNVHTVTLDTSGLIYSWLDVKKGMRSARQLRHVPRAKLGAVQLWHEQWPAPPDDRIYIADLLHAVPGEEVTARRFPPAAAQWSPRELSSRRTLLFSSGLETKPGKAPTLIQRLTLPGD